MTIQSLDQTLRDSIGKARIGYDRSKRKEKETRNALGRRTLNLAGQELTVGA
jgi:hypothetical protein